MTKLCPKCGYTNAENVELCRTCGFPLVRECPRCGTKRSWREERCPRCEPKGPDASESRLFTELFQSTPHQSLRKRYVVKALISRSRVSAVYRVRDTHVEGSVFYALKEISDTALITADERREAASAFTRRAEAWARLDHPAVTRLVDYFSSRGKYYAVMSLIQGWNLTQICRADSILLREDVIRNWGAQLCDVLAYLQAQDVPMFLDDLKPGHVMVTRQGVVKLVDLGLTRLFLPLADAPRGREAVGPGVSSDTYAVGRILHGLLTRECSPRGETLAERDSSSSIPGRYSRELKAIVARAVHKPASSRFQSIAELREALWKDDGSAVQPITRWAIKRPKPLGESVAETVAPRGTSATVMERQRPRRVSDHRVGAPRAQRPEVRVSPRLIDFGDLSAGDIKKAVVTVRSMGSTPLVGRIVSHVPWMTVPQASFRCEPGQSCKLVVTAKADRLGGSSVNEPQALSVQIASAREWIACRAAIKQGPALGLREKVLDFGQVQGDGELTREVSVFNHGDGPLRGTLKSRVPWLSVPKGSFSCRPHGEMRLKLVLLTARLPGGGIVEPSALLLDSDAGQERIEVRVRRVQPLLQVEPVNLDFGTLPKGDVARRALRVTNAADGVLTGIIRSQVPWLQVEPDTIHCGPGESASPEIVLCTADMAAGTCRHEAALCVETNAGQQIIPARTEILAPRLSIVESRMRIEGIPLGDRGHHVLSVLNDGSAPLEAHVESALEWLTVHPDHFVCAPGESIELSIVADTSAFSRGLTLALESALRIASNDGSVEIGLELEILKPLVTVTPSVLDFGVTEMPEPVTRSLLIRNDGTGVLNWRVRTESQWVEIEPARGQSQAGKASEVKVTAYGLALPDDADTAEGVLLLSSDAGPEQIPMAMAIASPLLALDVSTIDLGISINCSDLTGSFTVFNRGLGTLVGSVRSAVDWLTVDPDDFECATGRSQLIHVRAGLEGQPSGPVAAMEAIHIDSNGGQAVLGVHAGVVLKPLLEVLSSPLQLGKSDPSGTVSGTLLLRNAGGSVARVQLSSSDPDLAFQRDVCLVKPGKEIQIGVRLAEDASDVGEGLSITARAEDVEIRVPVEICSESQR